MTFYYKSNWEFHALIYSVPGNTTSDVCVFQRQGILSMRYEVCGYDRGHDDLWRGRISPTLMSNIRLGYHPPTPLPLLNIISFVETFGFFFVLELN